MNTKVYSYKTDVAIIGGGLAGIVTARELLDNNVKVIIIDRDIQDNFGGLAKESFGGIMLVDTPVQRKSGIKDNAELAYNDWLSYAQFDDEDVLPKMWAEKYVVESIPAIYEWLTGCGIKFLPIVNWPERGLFNPGNSFPRWHIVWGTGKGIIDSVLNSLNNHPNRSKLQIKFNHDVNELLFENGRVTGCCGMMNNQEFNVRADTTVIASGGICGGNLDFLKQNWTYTLGKIPDNPLNGSHRYADGKLHKAVKIIGGRLTHLDNQWLYAAGIPHPNPDRVQHGLSLVPPRSALWMNALGKRIGPIPLVGYTDTKYLVEQIFQQPGQYSWQIMNWKIATKELAVSGSEYMTAFSQKKKLKLLKDLLFGNKELVNRLINESKNIIVSDSVSDLVNKMNELSPDYKVDKQLLENEIHNYDIQIDRGKSFYNDDQLRWIANFRNYRGDRMRVCKFQKINDSKANPLIAIKEHIISRKSLGGIQTNLNSQVLNKISEPIDGLYSVGEAAGFGGGGIHGKGSLEGTFLGSCILTGRVAANSIVA